MNALFQIDMQNGAVSVCVCFCDNYKMCVYLFTVVASCSVKLGYVAKKLLVKRHTHKKKLKEKLHLKRNIAVKRDLNGVFFRFVPFICIVTKQSGCLLPTDS